MLGLWLNLASLEALDDLRHIQSVGALLAAEKGQQYIDRLAEIAWEHDPEAAEIVKLAARASNAERGIMSPTPQE